MQNGMAKLELIAFFSLLLSFLDYHLHWVDFAEANEKLARKRISFTAEPSLHDIKFPFRVTTRRRRWPEKRRKRGKGANKMGENRRKMRNSSDHRQ